MMDRSLNRRDFLQASAALAAAPLLPSHAFAAGPEAGVTGSVAPLGRVATLRASEISSSPFGLGCEVLDRGLWEPRLVYPWLGDLPVKWARLQTGWERTERHRGRYDWAWLDESVDGLIERGIQPFFDVGYGNTNYTPGQLRKPPLDTADGWAAWQRFVAELTRRYRGRIRHFEIWNEPNLAGFWGGEVDARAYMRLVAGTAPIIRANNPDAVIVGGVVSRLPAEYTRELFEAGLAQHAQVFSYHPYGTISERYDQSVQALQRMIAEFAPGMPVWQGENGYPSDPGSTGFSGVGPWTENVQAKVMLRRMVADCALGMQLSLWFLAVDLHNYPEGTDGVNYKGILRYKPEVKPKVSYHALRYLGSVLHGEIRPRNAVVNAARGVFGATADDRNALMHGVWPDVPLLRTAPLTVRGAPALGYWVMERPSDLRRPDTVTLLLSDWDGAGFRDPVLVDPLTGVVSTIPTPERTAGFDRSDTQIFASLPLTDYPMLLVERDQVKLGAL